MYLNVDGRTKSEEIEDVRSLFGFKRSVNETPRKSYFLSIQYNIFI